MIDAARPVKLDLDWLRHEMENLADILRLANDAHKRHQHGVVYALRMTADDLEGLRWHNSMGIETAMPVPASKIVSKIVVPPDYEANLFVDTGEEYLRRMNCGLLAALAAQAR
jgi:hypothetical protein